MPTIVVFSIVSILYIATGGVQAVVWTNVFQAVMFLVAGAVTLAYLVVARLGRAGHGDLAPAGAAGTSERHRLGPVDHVRPTSGRAR